MKRNFRIAAGLLVVVLLAAAPAMVLADAGNVAPSGNVLQTMQSSLRGVTQKILPSVVEINVKEAVSQQQLRSPFGQVPRRSQGTVSALGSGIIVRHTGDRYYVLTNNHVIDNATEVSVKLNDGRDFTATVVGKDPLKDLGMVSFTASDNLQVAALADSDALQVGDLVIAVDNPLGFESTVTMGIVSAVGRHGPSGDQASAYTNYIQTDAAINEGNSGGALVNIEGQVVGINTWIAAPSGRQHRPGVRHPRQQREERRRSLHRQGRRAVRVARSLDNRYPGCGIFGGFRNGPEAPGRQRSPGGGCLQGLPCV